MLHLPQHIIADHALIAQPQQHFALRADRLPGHVLGSIALDHFLAVRIHLADVICDLIIIIRPHALQRGGRGAVVRPERIQPLDRRQRR